MDALDTIRRQIAAGERQEARRALVALLRNQPHHVTAWMLLATVLDDPQRQADCYRQVLSLEPGNQRAARALAQLSASEGKALRCPQCGGAMEVYFAGELQDKRARCRYCAAEVDLPDSFRRVQRTKTSESRPGIRRSEETITVESRSDEGNLQSLLAEHGITLTDETLDDLMGPETFTDHEVGLTQRVVARSVEGQHSPQDRPERRGCLSWLLGLFGKPRLTPSLPDETPVESIIEAAGGALSPDERRRCAQCGATVSRQASRCAWCDTRLDGAET